MATGGAEAAQRADLFVDRHRFLQMAGASLPLTAVASRIYGEAANDAAALPPHAVHGPELADAPPDVMLEAMEREAFNYFLAQRNPANGLAADRTPF